MTITAGTVSQVTVTSTSVQLLATAATGGTGPYTYQWYMSTVTGFTPGVGNIVSGATALSQSFTGLIPNTTYYFVLVATDTGHSNDTAQYTQFTSVTQAPVLNPNQFAQTPYLGYIDQRFPFNTTPVQIDVSQVGSLYAGSAVKIVDSAGGVPKVVGCSANSDNVFGFINFDIKTVAFTAGKECEISQSGNVMYLYSTTAIARGAQVTLALSTNGGVASKNSGDNIVGYAMDKFTAPGQLGRIVLRTPSFTTA